jgi:hypothetical protein
MTRLMDKGGDYDPVPCPLPDCGQALHLKLMSDQYLYASFTEEDLRGISSGDLNHWEVACEAGHVILVPPNDGAEEHLFGVCRCDLDDVKEHGHDDGCSHGDFDRLRRRLVNAWVVS